MSTRTIYSCDWCHRDAPTPGSVGSDWLVGMEPDHAARLGKEGTLTLCKECRNVRRDYLTRALRSVYAETERRIAVANGEASPEEEP